MDEQQLIDMGLSEPEPTDREVAGLHGGTKMKNGISYKELVFSVVVDDLQSVAKKRHGRYLNAEELYRAKKAADSGFSEGQWGIIETAVDCGMEGGR